MITLKNLSLNKVKRLLSNKKVFFKILFLYFLLLFSCKTPTKTEKADYQNNAGDNKVDLKQVDSVFALMWQNQFDYNYLNASFTAEYEVDKNSSSFSGQLRMKKDSVIWLSISKFSIEGARLLLYNDSFYYLNRVDETYFTGDFNTINRFINGAVDFDMLQAIILGNDFKYYENDKFKLEYDGKYYHLTTVNRRKLKKFIKNENDKLKVLIQNIFIDPVTFKIKELSVKEIRANNKLRIQYSNYKKIENQLFPMSMIIYVSAEKEIKISIDFSKVSVDSEQTFPFKIPKSYKKTESY
jgi:hypothetical protein